MNNLAAALAVFRFNTEQNPQSANVWDGLGEALVRAGKKEEALTSYRKAVSVAEAKGVPNLERFRKQVARLSEILRSGKQ
jgi:Flp pilus assembly protein TadD